ncbi:MAG: toprim domain-containing protein [Bacteroidota bacterium]|nr:toprim domain-containing protein [Bacteroidota bacterium]
MEIPDIKRYLSLSTVLQHYGLKPDRNNRLNCPFHPDRTPSMIVYFNTQTCYCFSTNCRTNSKSIDVIDFVMYKENFDFLPANEAKHRAILKAMEIAGINEELFSLPEGQKLKMENEKLIVNREETASSTNQLISSSDIEFLGTMFSYFKSVIRKSGPAMDYLKKRGLVKENDLKSVTKSLEIGFNSREFHRNKKDDALVENCLKVGLLINRNYNGSIKSYHPFGQNCIVFALRNRTNHVTGLYFRSILDSQNTSNLNTEKQKHYYLKNRQGLYPGYPDPQTKILILTEAIIDAATLLVESEKLKMPSPLIPLPKGEGNEMVISILACYGTNGLTPEHLEAIRELKELHEIIFAFDSDPSGEKATLRYAQELKVEKLKVTRIELPEGEDINSFYVAHQPEDLTQLFNNRKDILSGEKETQPGGVEDITELKVQNEPEPLTDVGAKKLTDISTQLGFDSSNPYKLTYKTESANYYCAGGIGKMADSMKVTLIIEKKGASGIGNEANLWNKSRNKIDLYEDKQVEKLCFEVSEKLQIRKDLLETDIYCLTESLEQYRENEYSKTVDQTMQVTNYPLTQLEINNTMEILNKPNLIKNIGELIGNAGIVGEEKNRIFLFIIAVSHITSETLHVLIQGSSGSGKTRQLRVISDCMPPESVVRLTRVSDKSFYNYPENYLKNKLVSLEDVDGLSEEAEYAYRELVSNGELISSTSLKEENGRITSKQKIVHGPIASMACTTDGTVYEDNISRMFLVAVDESRQQTMKVIAYQNAKSAGKIDTYKELEIKRQLQNVVRILKPLPVVNPFADKIHLPEEAHKLRRLNDLFKIFIHQVTLINQYQRKKNEHGKLISTFEDVEIAIEIMFDSIVLKIDELDGSLRQFYEKLKDYIHKTSNDNYRNYVFTQREIRQELNISKTQLHRYLNDLTHLEYINQSGFANRGFKYKVSYWDDYKAMREKIKKHLSDQLGTLRNATGTPETLKTNTLNTGVPCSINT